MTDRPSIRRILGAFLTLAAPMLLYLFVCAAETFAPSPGVRWAFAVNLALFVVLTVVLIAVHELCHALAARVLRYHVPRITLGIGRQVARFSVGATLIQICMIPVVGLTFIVPRSDGFRRLRGWLITAAGPALHIAIGFALLPVARDASGWRWDVLLRESDVVLTLFAANVWLLVINLLPIKTQHCASDGLSLILRLFAKLPPYEEEAVRLYSFRGYAALEEGRYADARAVFDEGLRVRPEDWLLRHDRAVAMTKLGEYVAARADYEALLEHPDVPAPARPFIQNNIAWCVVMADHRDSELDLADSLSREAHEAMPTVPSLLGTRGAVLALRGKLDDALSLLRKAFDLHATPLDRASNAAWISYVHAQQGNPKRSAQSLALARELDPDCRSIPVVESLLASRD